MSRISRLTATATLLVASLLATPPAGATTGPGCYRVIRVPAWDVLNVRKWPSPRSGIVTALSSSTYSIISGRGACRRGWCPVNVTGESNTKRGWIKARYLARSECP